MKVMLFGLDCAIGPRWKAYAESGALPVAEKLLAEGAYADNCLSPLPTLTSTNWTTIATGAWPGTHGITDFNIHKSGDDLMDCPQAFDSGDCQAEYIWNAAARQGKRTILLNYPATWPPVVENGVQIGGAGIEPTDWRLGLPAEDRRVSLGAEQLFSTEGEPLSNEIHWSGETEVTLRFAFAESLSPVATEVDLVCRVTADGGVTIHGAGAETAEVDAGSWSETIRMELDIGDERVIGHCRAKLLDLDRERNIFRLFFTDVCAVQGLVSPHDALEDLERIDGLPVATVGFNAVSLGWIDLGTFVEILDMSNRWMEQVAVHLIEREQWDLFFMHIHSIDWFYHVASTKLDSTQNPDEGERRLYEQAELRIYQSMDRLMGAILAAEDEPHLTVVVSDHGATSYTRHAPTREILVEAGLIVADETQPSPDLEPSDDDLVANWERAYWEPTDTVDWTRTLAVPQRSCYVYINLKGRDPHGVVEERDYEDVQERIRDALLSYRDPQTGLCPYSVVLRKQDARILGLYGDRVGDIVYAVREEFSDEHGQILGTAENGSGFGSMRCVLLLHGPGVKRGASVKRTAWLTDVAPTIAYLTGLPVPGDAEGAVLYQMLVDPDHLANSRQRAVDRYEKLASAVQRRQALTHQPMR